MRPRSVTSWYKNPMKRPIKETFMIAAAVSPVLAAITHDLYMNADLFNFVKIYTLCLGTGVAAAYRSEMFKSSGYLSKLDFAMVDYPIENDFEVLCHKAGVKGLKIRRHTGAKEMNAIAWANTVSLGNQIVENNDDNVHGFIMGHEISHFYNWDGLKALFISAMGYSACLYSPFNLLSSQNVEGLINSSIYLLAGLSVLHISQFAWSRAAEYRCDKDAVILNDGEMDGAKKFFNARSIYEGGGSFIRDTHPASHKRILHLKRTFG